MINELKDLRNSKDETKEVHSSFDKSHCLLMSLMFREVCKMGKCLKGAAMRNEGLFNPSAQGCWDKWRIKGHGSANHKLWR